MLKIAVLISGGGTNLQAIIDACENKTINGAVVGVISNKENAFGLKRALNHKIPHYYLGKKNVSDWGLRSQKVIETIENWNADLIVLAGYLEILHPDFIQAFKNRIINVHPSLIPKYAGKGFYGLKVHENVILNKERYSGATVHFVDEEVDTGQIIMQEALGVLPNDTAESLQERVLKIEHDILVRSINKFIKGDL